MLVDHTCRCENERYMRNEAGGRYKWLCCVRVSLHRPGASGLPSRPGARSSPAGCSCGGFTSDSSPNCSRTSCSANVHACGLR